MESAMISIVTPCYNEEDNVVEVIAQVRKVMESLPEYRYEHIFIDNASRDKTIELLKVEAEKDQRIKVIVNSRNFGYIRSSMHGMYQATGDAIILILADLQDPPEMISEFVKRWKEGDDAVSAFRAIVDNIDKFKDGYTEVDLGSGVSISIKHLVKKIKKITNNQVTCLEFGAIEYRSNEIMNSKANINLLKSLGWSPKINLDKGLHVTVNSLSHKQYDKNE